MALLDYAALASTASALIAGAGLTVTIRRAGTPTGNAWNPTAASPTDYTASAVDLGVRTYTGRDGLVTKTARTLLMAASAGTTPATGDMIQVGSAWHRCGEVRPLQPAGTVLLYECDLEG